MPYCQYLCLVSDWLLMFQIALSWTPLKTVNGRQKVMRADCTINLSVTTVMWLEGQQVRPPPPFFSPVISRFTVYPSSVVTVVTIVYIITIINIVTIVIIVTIVTVVTVVTIITMLKPYMYRSYQITIVTIVPIFTIVTIVTKVTTVTIVTVVTAP